MQSDNKILLYKQLSDIADKIGKAVAADEFTELNELLSEHDKLMTKIKQSALVNDKMLKTAIEDAEQKVNNAMGAIKQKQAEIIKQLSVGSNKKLLNNAYHM